MKLPYGYQDPTLLRRFALLIFCVVILGKVFITLLDAAFVSRP